MGYIHIIDCPPLVELDWVFIVGLRIYSWIGYLYVFIVGLGLAVVQRIINQQTLLESLPLGDNPLCMRRVFELQKLGEQNRIHKWGTVYQYGAVYKWG